MKIMEMKRIIEMHAQIIKNDDFLPLEPAG